MSEDRANGEPVQAAEGLTGATRLQPRLTRGDPADDFEALPLISQDFMIHLVRWLRPSGRLRRGRGGIAKARTNPESIEVLEPPEI